jgi:hypothetical protein
VGTQQREPRSKSDSVQCIAFQAPRESNALPSCAEGFELRGGPLLKQYGIALICSNAEDTQQSAAVSEVLPGWLDANSAWKCGINAEGSHGRTPLVKFRNGTGMERLLPRLKDCFSHKGFILLQRQQTFCLPTQLPIKRTRLPRLSKLRLDWISHPRSSMQNQIG